MAREAVTVRIGVAHLPRRCLSRPGPLDQRSVRGPPSASGSCWPASLPALPPVPTRSHRPVRPPRRRASSCWRRPPMAPPCSAGTDRRARVSRSRCPRATRPGSRPAEPTCWPPSCPRARPRRAIPSISAIRSCGARSRRPTSPARPRLDPISSRPGIPRAAGSRRSPATCPAAARSIVVLIDPSAGSAFEIAIDRAVVAAPPVWIDPDRLVVVTGDAAAPLAAIVDTTTSEVTDGPSGDRLLAASGDGKRIATMAGPGRPGRGAGHGRLARRRRLAARVDRPADELRDGDRLRPRWDRSATRRGMGGGGRLGQPRRPRWGLGLATRGAAGPRRGARRGGRLASLRMWRPGRGARGQAVTASAAAKIETCASSGSITPKTFWSARRWTHDPQLSK